MLSLEKEGKPRLSWGRSKELEEPQPLEDPKGPLESSSGKSANILWPSSTVNKPDMLIQDDMPNLQDFVRKKRKFINARAGKDKDGNNHSQST